MRITTSAHGARRVCLLFSMGSIWLEDDQQEQQQQQQQQQQQHQLSSTSHGVHWVEADCCEDSAEETGPLQCHLHSQDGTWWWLIEVDFRLQYNHLEFIVGLWVGHCCWVKKYLFDLASPEKFLDRVALYPAWWPNV